MSQDVRTSAGNAGNNLAPVDISILQDLTDSPTVLAFLQRGRDLLQDYEITLSLRRRT